MAPTNAASGTVTGERRATGRTTTAIVAPRPAPAAAPRRYGSASGFRNTAWYAAPDAESDAPTSPADDHARQAEVPEDRRLLLGHPRWLISEGDQPPERGIGRDVHRSDEQARHDGRDEHGHAERDRARPPAHAAVRLHDVLLTASAIRRR